MRIADYPPDTRTGLPSKTGVENYSCTNHFCIRIFCPAVIDDDDDDNDDHDDHDDNDNLKMFFFLQLHLKITSPFFFFFQTFLNRPLHLLLDLPTSFLSLDYVSVSVVVSYLASYLRTKPNGL